MGHINKLRKKKLDRWLMMRKVIKAVDAAADGHFRENFESYFQRCFGHLPIVELKNVKIGGTECEGCAHIKADCSALPFNTMRQIKRDSDGTVVVKCLNFEREAK